MGFLLNKWRGIGTRLYVALAFAVLLTLVSSGVSVFYFERSGDLNYKADSESVPVLEASWEAALEAERLRGLGLQALSGSGNVDSDSVGQALSSLEETLAQPSGLQSLASHAQAVQDSAYDVADSIDALLLNQSAMRQADQAAAALHQRMSEIPADTDTATAGLRLLGDALKAEDNATLDGMWDEFAALSQRGLEQPVIDAGGGDGVFAVRSRQLLLMEQKQALSASFDRASAVLEAASATLLEEARAESSSTFEQSLESFDQGRVLLAAISIVSVVATAMAAWLWVGNAVVRRLSILSERMRGMAAGDLETPVPEISRDEIGQLADALEHFRQQALEVQRLNLVERLYGELQEANAELTRMQARLVAQEKLAALGELVSGVAHEISNPLNFVKNFSEGSLDLYEELSEMLDDYRDQLSDADASLLDELSGEITDSLGRIVSNGGRALAIVERMRGLSAEGGALALTNLNYALRQAAQQGCETFEPEFDDFHVDLEFDLGEDIGEQMLAERDFGEAVINLVSNACFAMQLKRSEQGQAYQPRLNVSSRLAGETVEVGIRDNGPGIPDDNLGRIFNPFFSTREGALGAGLGLSIAADVARRMGGDLLVDTSFGEYAEFTMHLPVTSEAEPDDEPAPEGMSEVVERFSARN